MGSIANSHPAGAWQLPTGSSLAVDKWGSLLPFELKSAPFDVSRVFLVSGHEGVTRGRHAHLECHQLLICFKGSVECKIVNVNGVVNTVSISSSRDVAVYLPPLHWGEQIYTSADSNLLVLASHQYDAGDYIRDFEEFLNFGK